MKSCAAPGPSSGEFIVTRSELEQAIGRLTDVVGCRITTDAVGAVTGVHVESAGTRPMPEIVGDVVDLLWIDGGIRLDPSRVHVTWRTGDEIPAVTVALEELEHEVRIRLTGLRTTMTEERSSVEVDLVMSAVESAVGYAETRGSLLPVELFAEATLDAIEKLCGERVVLRLLAVHQQSGTRSNVVSVLVEESDGRDSRIQVGASQFSGDPGRAAAYAALAAMNRRIGRILAGPVRNYRIA
jgi:hypothetical protein